MTAGTPNSVTALPPLPPDLAGAAALDDPWLATAADLVATLAEAPGTPAALVPTGHPDLDHDGGLAPGTLSAIVAAPDPPPPSTCSPPPTTPPTTTG
jgi:hypothetical protein